MKIKIDLHLIATRDTLDAPIIDGAYLLHQYRQPRRAGNDGDLRHYCASTEDEGVKLLLRNGLTLNDLPKGAVVTATVGKKLGIFKITVFAVTDESAETTLSEIIDAPERSVGRPTLSAEPTRSYTITIPPTMAQAFKKFSGENNLSRGIRDFYDHYSGV